MNILFAIKRLELQSGGSERVLVHVANALADRGFSLTVLTWDAPGSEPFYRLVPEVKLINRGKGDSSRPTRPRELIDRTIDLRLSVLEAKPDIVFGFGHSMFVPLAFALVGTGIPLVACEHAALTHYRNRPPQFTLLRLAIRFVHCMTVTTAAVGAEYPRDIRDRSFVLPNPIMLPDFVPGERVSQKVLSVGRLDPQKDHTTLILAFARIASRFPDWRLEILGEGGLRPELEKLVGSLGLSARISLPGITKEISGAYANADIFALPSIWESFGLAALEAMSQGLPVLAFADCSGVNELVADQQTGLLVSPSSDRVSAFEHGLVRLMTDKDLRLSLGNNAREHAEQLAQSDDTLKLWERLIAEILSGRQISLCAA